MTLQDKRMAVKESMERQRFGATRREIMSKKGAKCVTCGTTKDLVIDHIKGGGRHHTERGLLSPLTHDIKNLQIQCRSCAGRKDRLRRSMGMGIEGNSNNPSQ